MSEQEPFPTAKNALDLLALVVESTLNSSSKDIPTASSSSSSISTSIPSDAIVITSHSSNNELSTNNEPNTKVLPQKRKRVSSNNPSNSTSADSKISNNNVILTTAAVPLPDPEPLRSNIYEKFTRIYRHCMNAGDEQTMLKSIYQPFCHKDLHTIFKRWKKHLTPSTKDPYEVDNVMELFTDQEGAKYCNSHFSFIPNGVFAISNTRVYTAKEYGTPFTRVVSSFTYEGTVVAPVQKLSKLLSVPGSFSSTEIEARHEPRNVPIIHHFMPSNQPFDPYHASKQLGVSPEVVEETENKLAAFLKHNRFLTQSTRFASLIQSFQSNCIPSPSKANQVNLTNDASHSMGLSKLVLNIQELRQLEDTLCASASSSAEENSASIEDLQEDQIRTIGRIVMSSMPQHCSKQTDDHVQSSSLQLVEVKFKAEGYLIFHFNDTNQLVKKEFHYRNV